MKAGALQVIAVESFTDKSGTWHQYGHEFSMDNTPERAELLEAGTIRVDDRMTKGRTAEPQANGEG